MNRTILEVLEQTGLALRVLHARLRYIDEGDTFGGFVTRSRPRASRYSRACSPSTENRQPNLDAEPLVRSSAASSVGPT